MTLLWKLSAAQLEQGYRSGAFSPVDALQACLSRTAACQPLTNAFVALDTAGALEAARQSQARWQTGHPLGPLDGVPVSVKDNMHVAGMPTTWGSRLLQGFVPAQDELPVARLRAGGAVIFGKTNLPEFAAQGYTHNALHGTTRNPWDTSLTPGGSSGGAVAAVSSGCGPLALATDGGGSIRRPASHTGLVGFKPSGGLVARGQGLPEIFLEYEVAGAIARTVDDARQLTALIAGQALAAPARSARILHVSRLGSSPVDPDISMLVGTCARNLAALGHKMRTSGEFVMADDINTQWPVLSQTGLAAMFDSPDDGAQLPPLDESLCTPAVQEMLRAGRAAPPQARAQLSAAISALREQLAQLFQSTDFILTPAAAALPWPAAQTHPEYIAGHQAGPRGHAVFTAFANAAGLPAIALPAGFVRGMPAGFQLVGPPGADAWLLTLAADYEKAFSWAQYWPHLPA